MTREYDVVMVGPRGVGKTSCLAAMCDNLQATINKLGYFANIPSDLIDKKNALKGVAKQASFTVENVGLVGNANRMDYKVSLSPHGTKESDISVNFVDIPGGWYQPSDSNNDQAKRALEKSLVSFWCIDSVSMIEANSTHHEAQNAPDFITEFYNSCKIQPGHRIVFVLMRAEKYVRDPKKGAAWLLNGDDGFKKHYVDVIGKLKARWGGSIEYYVTYVETLGNVQFTHFSENPARQIDANFAVMGKGYDPSNCDVPPSAALEKILKDAMKIKIHGFIMRHLIWGYRLLCFGKAGDPMEPWQNIDVLARLTALRPVIDGLLMKPKGDSLLLKL